MVKTISELYLEARRALMTQEQPQDASLMARNLLCHITGMTQEQVLSRRDMYVDESVCEKINPPPRVNPKPSAIFPPSFPVG